MSLAKIVRALLISTALLIVPISASWFAEGWNWDGSDYVFAWVLFSFLSLSFTWVMGTAYGTAYKIAIGLSAMAAFLLIWINGAVGIIGSEDNPANLLYAGVLAVLFLGAIFSRLHPSGMARMAWVAALTQALVPVVALLIWRPDFSPGVLGVFVINGFFVMFFVGAALLFRQARTPDLSLK